MSNSPKPELTKVDYEKIKKDILYFALIPISFYLLAVLGVLQLPNHIISLNDFIPSNNTVIAIVTWVLGQILNIIRKYLG